VRVAALADVHGNLPALEAVLEDVRREGADLIVFCGDVASGPMPSETIDVLRALPNARFVRGNADRGVVDEFDGRARSQWSGPFVEWCASEIDQSQRDFLASFETTIELNEVEGIGRALFCHAVPANDFEIITEDTPVEEVGTVLRGVNADAVVCGHTHMQYDRQVGVTRLINAGSVGMSYIRPGAFWAFLGPGLPLRHTAYDRTEAAARIRSKDWSGAEDFAENNVIRVPSAADVMGYLGQFKLQRSRRREVGRRR